MDYCCMKPGALIIENFDTNNKPPMCNPIGGLR